MANNGNTLAVFSQHRESTDTHAVSSSDIPYQLQVKRRGWLWEWQHTKTVVEHPSTVVAWCLQPLAASIAAERDSEGP